MAKEEKKSKSKGKKGKATINQIIEAACNLFIDKGYHATSMRDIADEIGLTPSAFYNHFRTKEDLFPAVLQKYHPWLIIPPTVAKLKGKELEDIIRNASEKILEKWNRKPDYVRLHLIELIEFHGQHLPELFDQTFIKMGKAIETLISNNPDLKDINADALSRSLLGLFFAYLMSDRYTGADFLPQNGLQNFSYFTDIYLQGALQQSNLNKQGDKKE